MNWTEIGDEMDLPMVRLITNNPVYGIAFLGLRVWGFAFLGFRFVGFEV